uniref:Alp7A family actin-like protein n=1 Tax=Bacillus multifaciens TaxID=3068506 RepID=UPI003F494CD6
MNIARFNADFGNSVNNFLIDGYYLEFTTAVVELTKEQADRHFVDSFNDPKELLGNMLISVVIDDEERYFLVGEAAAKRTLSDNHVSRMHNKIKSHIPYVSFLSAVAYYNAIKATDNNAEVEVESMNMMLPIWLLMKAEKFSVAQNEMAARFEKEHKFKVHTPGLERDITINVKKAKCRAESEIARYGIKYALNRTDESNTLKVEKRKSAAQFENVRVNLVDIGGGSTDAVTLGAGLSTPKSRDDFKVIDVQPYLGKLEEFRKEKVLELFPKGLRSLENFIVQNYSKQTYKLVNGNTGESHDLTKLFTAMLNDYASLFVDRVLNSFDTSSDEVMVFVYFGGEAPILDPYIRQNLLNHMSPEAADKNHLFLHDIIEKGNNEIIPVTPRTINLISLEVRSIIDAQKVKA